MINFLIIIVIIIASNIYVTNPENDYSYIKSFASALGMIMVYIALKGLAIRSRTKVSPIGYRFISTVFIPICTITFPIIFEFLSVNQISYNYFTIIVLYLSLCDFSDDASRYVKNSNFFENQKDTFFMPAENDKSWVWSYYFKVFFLYVFLFLFYENVKPF